MQRQRPVPHQLWLGRPFQGSCLRSGLGAGLIITGSQSKSDEQMLKGGQGVAVYRAVGQIAGQG